jgi:phosphoribosylformimino-5-aminoimidazole carboxamide ribotide isomerase
VELYPAIDVRAGRAVRLRQGDYADETVYGDDPVAIASDFVRAGAAWIHVVDLDAARSGEPINRATVAGVAAAAATGHVRVQSGGGVRSDASADALWSAGVARVVVGTAAVEEPDLVRRLATANPGGVAVGIDGRDGEVALRGWLAGSGVSVADLAHQVADLGATAVIVTDIGRDGMLAGPDLPGLARVLDVTPVDVIASGGVSSVADLVALAALRGPTSGRALAGAIVGKAIYEGRLTVEEGVAACAPSG